MAILFAICTTDMLPLSNSDLLNYISFLEYPHLPLTSNNSVNVFQDIATNDLVLRVFNKSWQPLAISHELATYFSLKITCTPVCINNMN